MSRRPHLSLLSLPGAVCLLGTSIGCGPSWRPSLEAVRTRELPVTFALSRYLSRAPGGEWVYQRSSATLPPDGNLPYRSRMLGCDRIEGRFVGRPIAGLSSRLADNGQPNPDVMNQIDALFAGGKGFILTFEPPLAMYPSVLTPNETVETRADIRHFDRAGRPRSAGTVVRRVLCEGLETATTPAGTFENCLRLRVEMTFRIHWGPTIETTEYLWLARDVGIVRRIERIAGLVWIFLFETTTEYALTAHRPDPTPPASSVSSVDFRLKCAAVLFDRGLPTPVLSGMFQEFTTAALCPSSRPSE